MEPVVKTCDVDELQQSAGQTSLMLILSFLQQPEIFTVRVNHTKATACWVCNQAGCYHINFHRH